MDYKFFLTKLGALFLCLQQAGSILATDLKFIHAVMQLSFHTVVITANICTVNSSGSQNLAISISGTLFSTELHYLFLAQPFCSTNPQGILTRRRCFQLSGSMLEVLFNSGFCFLHISLSRQETLQHRKQT